MKCATFVVIAVIATFSRFSYVEADCTAQVDSEGGWFSDSGGTWFKGAEYTACEGTCVRWEDSAPFTSVVEGQPIVEPTAAPWYDADNLYWCPTVSSYSTSGSNKKRWGYCSCPIACSTFTTKGTCKTSLATDPAVTCYWYKGTCYDTPDCNSANDVFSGKALKDWCQDEDGCGYNGTCVTLPNSCEGVNGMFSQASSDYKNTCEEVSGCMYSAGDCTTVPETCSGIEALQVSGKVKEDLCEDANCTYVDKTCLDSPQTCADIDGLSIKKSDKQDLCKDKDGCFFSTLGCQSVPGTCSALDALDLAPKVKRRMCRDLSGCAYVQGQCVSTPADCADVEALDLNDANTKALCDGTDGCFYASGSKTCVDTPNTCTAIDAVDVPNPVKKRMCGRIDGCYYLRGNCMEIPSSNCSGIDALDAPQKMKAKFCRDDTSCFYNEGTCNDLPGSCADVNTALSGENPNGNFFKSICSGVTGCGVYNRMCRTAPTSCANVETYYDGVDNGEKRRVCRSIESEPCDMSSGVCGTVSCTAYKGQKGSCKGIAACSYVRGNCCTATHSCLAFTKEQCEANTDTCVYKGRGPNKDCTCINE